jgi:hypothetical protein
MRSPDYVLCFTHQVSKTTVRPGEGFSYKVRVCRGVDAHAGDLSWNFHSGQEQYVNLVTRNDAANVETARWTWGADKEFTGGPHEDAMPMRTCFTWHGEWDGLGDDGRALKPGTYWLLFAVGTRPGYGTTENQITVTD